MDLPISSLTLALFVVAAALVVALIEEVMNASDDDRED
jgi:hypothetical protein